jgi:hypothetical protein
MSHASANESMREFLLGLTQETGLAIGGTSPGGLHRTHVLTGMSVTPLR